MCLSIPLHYIDRRIQEGFSLGTVNQFNLKSNPNM